MSQRYLLSTYTMEGEGQGKPPSPEEMQQHMDRITTLEAEMRSTGTFVFSGRLHGPDQAAVVTPGEHDPVVTDGPFPEAKEQIAGFYIIDAADHEAATQWAKRVSACINRPIEARAFADHDSA
jgi:hypothetical protein